MIGILIVSHGAFGEALIHSASHVLGKRPLQVQQLGVTVHDDPDAILPQAQELARQLDSGEGVLVLTDILGATPSASLPMLIRALTYREEPLAAVVGKAVSGGCDGVVRLNSELRDAANRG